MPIPGAVVDGNYDIIPGNSYDATGHQFVLPAATQVTTDSTNGVVSGAYKIQSVAPYPVGATPITASSANVAAAVAAATLAAVAGKTTYITGFAITGSGATTGLPVSVTVTGVITGTLTYTYTAVAGVLVANTPLVIHFSSPIPASATNTTIVVSCPTLGSGNTNNTTNAYGFQI